MTKKLAVDVKKSLGYKTNGRLKPAKKVEYANISEKQFQCIECGAIHSAEPAAFGEFVECEKCGGRMVEVLE